MWSAEPAIKDTLSRGARPLTGVGFGGADAFLKVLLPLFPAVLTPSPSLNSFPSYSTPHAGSLEVYGRLTTLCGLHGKIIHEANVLISLGQSKLSIEVASPYDS